MENQPKTLLLLQVIGMINDKQLFVDVFNDLSFELDEMGYDSCPEVLVNDLLENHFNLSLSCNDQLKAITEIILEKQGKLEPYVALVDLKFEVGVHHDD